MSVQDQKRKLTAMRRRVNASQGRTTATEENIRLYGYGLSITQKDMDHRYMFQNELIDVLERILEVMERGWLRRIFNFF